METEAMRNETGAFTEQSMSLNSMTSSPAFRSRLGTMFAELTDGVRQDLISYLDEKGLVNDPDILVIPSTRHYFYDADDMKGVKTMVNLKPLNYVREIRDFLRKVSELLPEDSNFVGCFTDNKLQNGFSDKYGNLPRDLSEKAEAYENGIESRIPFINRMYSFIDLKTNRYLTGRTVANLL
ncbi:MAG TPA: hypothetical protein P5197_01315, partial [Bacteroidales bacterium]|nr:hypothetical protein [Bacteroidales bacterium]HRW26092.1 hypothetical protein [Bacteroidales bacterium]